ncbi:MAG TPA: peptidoglycan editing factor PgeF [Mycobacteriales bacterium]|nr:peptidoglycan editing factor PgeF [Mycobacteriales bacterium]
MPLALPVEPVGAARFAFTTREGGVSRPPYDSLDLATHVGDDPAVVAENRRRVVEAAGVDALVVATQVHGSDVVEVHGPWAAAPPEADALVTTVPRLALGVLVADCTPVLLAAPEEGVVGVAHAGRKGMAAGVVPRLVEAVRDLGGRSLVARLGPSVCGRCYEVPAALRDEVAAAVPVAASVTWHGTPSLDVAAGVLEQLAPHCRSAEQRPGCTVERADLYSYRRDRTTGRSAGLAWLAA